MPGLSPRHEFLTQIFTLSLMKESAAVGKIDGWLLQITNYVLLNVIYSHDLSLKHEVGNVSCHT